MNKIKVGVIGIGNIGTAHASSIYAGKIENATLTAVCDISDDRKQFAKESFPNVDFYQSYDQMILSGTVDAVIIATPHKLHAEIAMKALENGLHVLVEKPVDVTVSKALELNEIANKTEKVFAIMFNQRTNPIFKRAREIVKSGEFGEIKRTNWIITNWYRQQKYYDSGTWRATWFGEGGGVLLNQAPHNLDLWQWICGMPCEITAFCDIAKYHRIEVEDDVTIFARYHNGATGTFVTTTGEYPGTNRLEIALDKGKIVIENGILKCWKLPLSEREICFSDCDLNDVQAEYSEYKETDELNGHIEIIKNFIDSVIGGAELLSPGTDGIHELMLSNAAYLSEYKGNTAVKIPFDSKEFDAFLQERINSGIHHPQDKSANVSGKYLKRWNVNW